MNISASQLSSSITSVSNSNSITKNLFQNTNMFSGESIGDSLDISEQGMMMSKMMSRMNAMDPSQMVAKMDDVKSKIDGLGLQDMDVDSMSRDELESAITEIQDIMKTMKPQDIEGGEFNLSEMSDDELRDMITKFSDKSQQIEGGMGRLKEMGGMMDMMAQNGMSDMYQDMLSTDETSETDLVDMLLSALESDDEDEDSSYFSQTIADYFSDITL